MEGTLWTVKNGQDINRISKEYPRKRSWFEKKYFMHVWQGSIRIWLLEQWSSCFWFPGKGPWKSYDLFSWYYWQRGIINLSFFQIPVMYTSQVLFIPLHVPLLQNRPYKTIKYFQVPSSTPTMQTLHPRSHLTLTKRKDLGHFFIFSLSILFLKSYTFLSCPFLPNGT